MLKLVTVKRHNGIMSHCVSDGVSDGVFDGVLDRVI